MQTLNLVVFYINCDTTDEVHFSSLPNLTLSYLCKYLMTKIGINLHRTNKSLKRILKILLHLGKYVCWVNFYGRQQTHLLRHLCIDQCFPKYVL